VLGVAAVAVRLLNNATPAKPGAVFEAHGD